MPNTGVSQLTFPFCYEPPGSVSLRNLPQNHGDTGQQASDRRAADRQRVLWKGSILFLEAERAIDCVVLDISGSGARIRPCDLLSCPERFRLTWLDEDPRLCEAVWRDATYIGVRFL
jgi:hypothetical protein